MPTGDLRPFPPPLEVQNPICPMCGEEVEHDGDDYACYTCHAYWAPQTAGHDAGTWTNDEAARCGAIDGRFLPGGTWASSDLNLNLYRCVLDHEHDTSEHRYADARGNRRCWDDSNSATPQQLADTRTAVGG